MTIATLRDETAIARELSTDELDQVTAGAGGHTLQDILMGAGAVGILVGFFAGIIGHFARGE